jgi:DNA-binding PadR family transcriptional regulator
MFEDLQKLLKKFSKIEDLIEELRWKALHTEEDVDHKLSLAEKKRKNLLSKIYGEMQHYFS